MQSGSLMMHLVLHLNVVLLVSIVEVADSLVEMV